VSGIGCGGALLAEAHERWGSGALQRAGHGDGEVAAAELGRVAWRGEERSSARGSGSKRSLGCRVGWWAKQEVACGLPRRRAAPLSAGGGEAERERGGRRLLGLFANSKKFRDPTVKLK